MVRITLFTFLKKKMEKEAEREQEKKMHKRTLCPASGLDRESQCKSVKECAMGLLKKTAHLEDKGCLVS